ncbi:MAG: CocE/NonD family hydrolase [Nitrososphaerales archaeon]
MKVEKDVLIPMRDGTNLAADLYLPDSFGRFPALLSMHAYGKDIEELVTKVPKMKALVSDYIIMEAGDHEFWAAHGYVHVIADVRGTGKSEGKYHNWFSPQEQKDGYDLVEWIAAQPWCDGNVGMTGISYLAIIQYLVAAQQPPHLKAIFPHDGWADTYRDIAYHGGIPSVFPEILRRNIATRTAVNISESLYSEDDLEHMVDELKNDDRTNYNRCPLIYENLVSRNSPMTFDFYVNRFDGEFYRERSPAWKMDRIKVPTYLGSEMHQAYTVSMHLPGATTGWERITAPKKLAFRPAAGGLERPFHEFHDEMLRWFDYWLRGIENGIMSEPPVKIWVRGAEKWRFENEWPLISKTEWKRFYLRSDRKLSAEPPDLEEASDGLFYKPAIPLFMVPGAQPYDPRPESISYLSEPFERDVEIIGPVALYLHVSLTSDDADFIIALKDVNPDGTGTNISRGWLKASHRELDAERSRPWQPFHPHTRALPVPRGEVLEYAIEIRPIANLFRAGHRMQIEVWPCDYPSEPYYDWTLSWGRSNHIPYGNEVRYEIHHSKNYQSHLLLPVIK